MSELFDCGHPSSSKMAAIRGYFSQTTLIGSLAEAWVLEEWICVTVFMFQFPEEKHPSSKDNSRAANFPVLTADTSTAIVLRLVLLSAALFSCLFHCDYTQYDDM